MIRYLIFLLFPFSAMAHPGIGIVKDTRGNIYYTDLEHVWRIAPDGKKTIAVASVHTHELSIDTSDNLYGEHLWYNGEALNTWGHYVWSLKANGELIKIKENTAGFLEDYGFHRDDSGNVYWAERWKRTRFKKRLPDGTVKLLAEIKTKDLRWSYVNAQGVFYFIDQKGLYKVEAGKAVLVTDQLTETTPAFTYLGDRHSVYGIWSDDNNNLYVALLGGQKVKKITPGGAVSTLIHVSSPWSPTGGVFDNNGDLWLLETSLSNEIRVRKILKSEFDGTKTTGTFLVNFFLPVGIVIFLFALVFYVLWKYIRHKKKYQPA